VFFQATVKPTLNQGEYLTNKLIGLLGPARVGKDTVCKALGIPRIAFADRLKADIKPLLDGLNLDLSKIEDKTLARPLMVEYGRLARAVDPDHWVKRIVPPGGFGEMVCVTDVRYLNEVNFIRKLGGEVFRLYRKGISPANDEERRSLNHIAVAEGVFEISPIVTIDNSAEDNGEAAAAEIRKHL
jgi:hypothetical protein